MPVLVRELLALYAAEGADDALPRAIPYRRYLAWLAGQDRAAAKIAWQEALAGLEPTHLIGSRPGLAVLAPAETTVELDLKLTLGARSPGAAP